jgi:hypothetical protein
VRNSIFRRDGADFQAGAVIVGTYGNQSLRVAGEAFGASVLGLSAQLNINLAKPGRNRLTLNALDGDDILIGGLGQDDRDGGPGHNDLIQ